MDPIVFGENSSYITNLFYSPRPTCPPHLCLPPAWPPVWSPAVRISTAAMSSDSAMCQWTLVLVLTALFLSLVVVAQVVARYGAAYRAAPREMAALLDSADSSLQENESFDRDVACVARCDDKVRLGRLLREIQRAGDDLREDLNAVLAVGSEKKYDGDRDAAAAKRKPAATTDRGVSTSLTSLLLPTPTSSTTLDEPEHTVRYDDYAPTPRLRTSARILWAAKRTHLEERLRRLDLLRMRFLVVYMSIVAATATAAADKVEKSAVMAAKTRVSRRSSSSDSDSSDSSGDNTRTSTTTTATSATTVTTAAATAAAPSTPPLSPRLPQKKTTASIVAASIAAAAAAAVAAGDTDGLYYPTTASPVSSPTAPESPASPLGADDAHPQTHPHLRPLFLRSIQQRHQTAASSSGTGSNNVDAPGDDASPSTRLKTPSRRVTTLGIQTSGTTTATDTSPENNHRAGWMGVVQELQRSPLLHKRHTSIETSMARR